MKDKGTQKKKEEGEEGVGLALGAGQRREARYSQRFSARRRGACSPGKVWIGSCALHAGISPP